MNGSNDDDFQELSSLLFGAKERYSSARATILHTVDAAVAEEANRRFVDWRFTHGGGVGMVRENRGEWLRPPSENSYRSYEDSEQVVCIWHERPDRWREEIQTPDGSTLRCVVFGGANGPRWVYEPPETAIHNPVGVVEWPHEDPRTYLSFMLDPAEELFYYALLDDAIVHRTGRREIVVNREAAEMRVETISWGHPPSIFHGYDAMLEGTTDHMLLVDAEIGTILRVAARLEEREFRVAEVTEISYDEELSEGTFTLDLPGVEFRR